MVDITDSTVVIQSARRQQKAGRRLSDLRRWIDENYAELTAAPLDHVKLAQDLNDRGLKDAYGRKLNARMLASAFARAKAERSVKAPSKTEPERQSHRPTPISPESPTLDSLGILPINPKETP